MASLLLGEEELDHVCGLPFRDAGYGYDAFGLEPNHVALALGLLLPLYRHYFRVESRGTEHIPAEGPVIVTANHSGTLPIDGMMLWTDMVLQTGRFPRTIADYFVPALPFVGTFFARAGMVGGSRGNLRAILEAGELALIFPEGVPGVAKPFRERYRLQEWRVGHAELALRHRAQVVPVAVIGAEEQMPQLAKLTWLGRLMGLPHLPVTATPLPLPVRYHLHYGKPLRLYEGLAPADADDPDVVREAADKVKAAVEALVAEGLRLRQGIFQ